MGDHTKNLLSIGAFHGLHRISHEYQWDASLPMGFSIHQFNGSSLEIWKLPQQNPWVFLPIRSIDYGYMGVSVGFQQISCEFPWNALPWRISWNFHGIARWMYCVTYDMQRSMGFPWHICDLMDSMHPQLFHGICHGMFHGKAR